MLSPSFLRRCLPAVSVGLVVLTGTVARAQDPLAPKPLRIQSSVLTSLRTGTSRTTTTRPLLLNSGARPTTRSMARRLDQPRLSNSFLPDLTTQWDGTPLPELTSTPEMRLEQRGLQSAGSAAARRKRQARAKTTRTRHGG